MRIAVAGLGLIGGSIARALTERSDHDVIGWNRSADVAEAALRAGAISAALTEESMTALSECDAVIIALYPEATIAWLDRYARHIKRGALVMDSCGVKGPVCSPCARIAAREGLAFVGAHPMAGMEHSGFAHSRGDLFDGASMILVPTEASGSGGIERASALAREMGFGRIVVTDEEEHDRMIAYTSQLAHAVSSAYVLSPCSSRHVGFSAGSYRDMTRVACLNEDMWTELFMENSAPLASELGALIERLERYRAAIAAKDAESVRAMLRAGRERKEEADGKFLR